MKDEQLVKRCLKKDALAQKLLFDTFSRKMMGVCLRYFDKTEEAEDALQMGFIKVFDRLDSYSMQGSLEGWIRRVIVNTALDMIRKNKKFKGNLELEKVDYQLDNPVESALDVLSAKDLLVMIREMPTGFRTVFNLYVIEGYSHREIAEQLGISEGTSKSQYSRARAYLKRILEKESAV